MILCIENFKDLRKNTVKINESSKVSGYKINIQKSCAFLYFNNELAKEIKKNYSTKSNKLLRN